MADIQRYLQGSMLANEMHDMERAALQDPFLADAIEGFTEAPFDQSKAYLNDIGALLQAEKEDAKVVVMPAKDRQWWRIAALFILIAGVGTLSWYAFSLNDTAQEKNIAQVIVAKEKNVDTGLQPSMIDPNSSFVGGIATKDTNDTYKEKEGLIIKGNSVADTQAADDTDKELETVATKRKVAETPTGIASDPVAMQERTPLANAITDLNNDTAYYNKDHFSVSEFKGRVTDNNDHPIANAIVSAGDLHPTYTDASGYFSLKAPDSSLNVTVSSIGFVSERTALKRNLTNNIAVVPDNGSLSEVVVTGYSTAKRAKPIVNNSDSAFPSGGWGSFQQYVNQQLRQQLDTLGDHEESDPVAVEFAIDKDGMPYDFKVIGSRSDAIALKAIDIIKHGPKWIATRKNKKAKVVIPF